MSADDLQPERCVDCLLVCDEIPGEFYGYDGAPRCEKHHRGHAWNFERAELDRYRQRADRNRRAMFIGIAALTCYLLGLLSLSVW